MVISYSIGVFSPVVHRRELTGASGGLENPIIVGKLHRRVEGLVIRRAEKYIALQRQPNSNEDEHKKKWGERKNSRG